MAGMWELPSLTSAPAGCDPMLNLKHAIMNTDYRVRVWAVREKAKVKNSKWWSLDDISGIPLTGLARKILRRASLI